METLFALLELSADASVLDIGTGNAEVLIRLVELYGVKAVGIERSPVALQRAREQIAARIPHNMVELRDMDASTLLALQEQFDVAICIGACEIFGGVAGTLRRLAQSVRQGGQLVVGELYWKQDPPSDYLTMLGIPREEYTTHANNVAIGVEQGFIPLFTLVTSDDEWDQYEWRIIHSFEQYAQEQPDDQNVPALLERKRRWRDQYLRSGRDTLGFALYLFQNGKVSQ
jgi:ubiquinone/menaquinone biosynthesis C-methylase UbiE